MMRFAPSRSIVYNNLSRCFLKNHRYRSLHLMSASTTSQQSSGGHVEMVVGTTACPQIRVAPGADTKTMDPAGQPQEAADTTTSVVYSLTKDPTLQTRHIVVYNTGPAIGVDLATLRKVFMEYGTVERLDCPNPKWSRVYVSFTEIAAAVRARAERNRPPEVEERVRAGVPRAAMASDVFAPTPGEPNPLLGRWLKVSFADIRVRIAVDDSKTSPWGGGFTSAGNSREFFKEFKAFDALAAGGTASTDSRQTPCPLCARVCGGQRGLRMHLIGAHPGELRDRDHLVNLLKQGSALIRPDRQAHRASTHGHRQHIPTDHDQHDNATPVTTLPTTNTGLNSSFPRVKAASQELDSPPQPPPRVGAGAAAKGRAGLSLPPGLAAAREGNLSELRRLVEGLGDAEPWDVKSAVDKNGSTPLDWAAGEGRLEVCRYLLLECGADPGRKCILKGRGEGRTALHWAARGGHEEVCRLLLETPRPAAEAVALPRNHHDESDSALSVNGNKQTNDGFSTDRYVHPDVPSAEGTTALHWACWGAHLSTCKMLVSRGAEHRVVNAHGCNVAHWCGLAGDVEVCRWLASSVQDGGAGGLDWGKTNRQGHTICHKAAFKGHRGLLEWLRLQTIDGVVPRDAWGRDEGGYLPRDVARLAGHLDLAEWLESAGC